MLVAIGIALVTTLVVVFSQPVRSAWWLYADADASYTASGIDLMEGDHSFYLDHPGMPLEALMAMTVETRYLAHKLTHEHATPRSYAGARLLHLDDSRIVFRGYAILFYVFGAGFAFWALWRLLGDPLWGTAGTLLWLAAPGLQAMSIQFRPDGLLAGLVLAVGYLVVRAAERRDAWLYALATLLLGLTITVKLHAAGLFLPLAIALVWRPPSAESLARLPTEAAAWLRKYRIVLVAFLAVWVLFCVTFDRTRVPFALTHEQRVTLVEVFGSLAGYLLAVLLFARTPLRRFARGPLQPFGAVLAAALTIGVLLPATVVINDLPEMLVKIVGGLTGSGVNQGVSRFTTPWGTLVHEPLLHAVILFGVAGIAAAVGLVRRDFRPVLWFSGAAATFLMATARLGTTHYFAPAFALSIPAALWLASLLPRRLPVVVAAALVAVALVPVLHDLSQPANAANQQAEQWAATQQLEKELLTQPGTVALSEDYVSANPDIRYYGLVQQFVSWTPDYPYRALPDTAAGLQTAETRRLRPTYFIGRLPLDIPQLQRVQLQFGSYVVEPLANTMFPSLGVGAMRLVHGPGVDLPLGHRDAPYDPETGYFKDPSGRYWDVFGGAIVAPAKRRYIPSLRLWADTFGDLWNATGRRVRNDPAYRTTK